MQYQTYVNSKSIKQAQQRDRTKKQHDTRIKNLVNIKQQITSQGIPNYNVLSQRSKTQPKQQNATGQPYKLPLKRGGGIKVQDTNSYDTHQIDSKMQQIENALIFLQNSKQSKQMNVGYNHNVSPQDINMPKTLIDQRLSLLKHEFYLAMDKIATSVHQQLKGSTRKKQAKFPTDKYLKNKSQNEILQTTDEVIRQISRNLQNIKAEKMEKQLENNNQLQQRNINNKRLSPRIFIQSQQQQNKYSSQEVKNALLQNFMTNPQLIPYTRNKEQSDLRQRQWYAAVNFNHGNAAIVRANLSKNPNIKQYLIYNYQDAIRWDPPKFIRSRSNRIANNMSSKYQQDKAFREIREMSQMVEDVITFESQKSEGFISQERIFRQQSMEKRRKQPEQVKRRLKLLPPPPPLPPKQTRKKGQKFAKVIEPPKIVEPQYEEDGQAQKNWPIPKSYKNRCLVIQIEIRNPTQTQFGVHHSISYPNSRQISQRYSRGRDNSKGFSPGGRGVSNRFNSGVINMHKTGFASINQQGFQMESGQFENVFDYDRPTRYDQKYTQKHATSPGGLRFSDSFDQQKLTQFRMSGYVGAMSIVNNAKFGKDIARKRKAGRDDMKKKLMEEEQRARNYEDFQDFIQYFPSQADITTNAKGTSGKASKNQSKNTGAPNKKDGKKAVAAYAQGNQEVGQVTFYGMVDKRRAKLNKFHGRWFVLRGIELYWYRSPSDHEQKGVIKIPTIDPVYEKIGKFDCFTLMQNESRDLTIRDNQNGHDFRIAVANSICIKQYLQERFDEIQNDQPDNSGFKNLDLDEQPFDLDFVNYFKNPHSDALIFKEKPTILKNFELICKGLKNHEQLMEINLSACGLQNEHLQMFSKYLTQSKNIVTQLNFSQNNLTAKATSSLLSILKSNNCMQLQCLIVDDNQLMDPGVQKLASGLQERFDIINKQRGSQVQLTGSFIFPLKYLSISGIGMGDQGLNFFVSRIESIRLKARAQLGSGDVFASTFGIDISKNNITDQGLKGFAEVLKNLNNLSYLKANGLRMAKGGGFKEIANSLAENHSLLELDYSGNQLRTVAVKSLLNSMRLKLPATRTIINLLKTKQPDALSNSFYISIDRSIQKDYKAFQRYSTTQFSLNSSSIRRFNTQNNRSVRFQQ